ERQACLAGRIGAWQTLLARRAAFTDWERQLPLRSVGCCRLGAPRLWRCLSVCARAYPGGRVLVVVEQPQTPVARPSGRVLPRTGTEVVRRAFGSHAASNRSAGIPGCCEIRSGSIPL